MGVKKRIDELDPETNLLITDITPTRKPTAGAGPAKKTTWEAVKDLFRTYWKKDMQEAAPQSATATGTDTYAVTLSPAPAAYAATQVFFVKFTNANTGASTLNVNSLGAKAIKKTDGTALSAGDIPAGARMVLLYDGTNFQVVGGIGSSATNQLQVLTYAGTTNWDFAIGNLAELTLTGNTTLNLTNVPANTYGQLKLLQDSSGSRTITLPGNLKTGFAVSTTGYSIDILSFYYDGTDFWWDIIPYGVFSPGGGITVIDFPTALNISLSGSNWVAGSGTGFDCKGLSNSYLAAGATGYIYFKKTTALMNCIFGFNTANSNDSFTAMEFGVYWDNNESIGALYGIEGGTPSYPTPIASAPATNDYIRVHRDGVTGVVKVDKSSDAVTWTNIHTFSGTSTAAFYINTNLYTGNGVLPEPKGYNLT